MELVEARLELEYGVGGKGYAHEWKDLGGVMRLLAWSLDRGWLASGLGLFHR